MKHNIIIKGLFAVFISAVTFFISANVALAAVTVTAATGGSSISADTTGGSFTTLTGPTATEGLSRDIPASGTFVLNAPSGFTFNTGATVTATITRLAGTGSCFTFTSTTATPAASTITFTLSTRDSNGTRCEVAFSNIQVRPTAGTPLASGDMTNTGTNTGFPSGTTNYGTLTEVFGVKNKLAFTTQPSATTTVNTDFAVKPVIKVQDQFGNTVTSDNSSTINYTVVKYDQACGGSAGSGTLSSTPASGAAVTAGVLTYTAMQYSYSEPFRICAASSGISSALSNIVAISPVVTNVTASNANGSYGVGQTIHVQVVFSSNVTVSGTPQLTLSTVSPATTNVNYFSGSGSNTLVFDYLIASGNSSADLDYSATTALALNGGSIKDTATGNTNAILTLASPGAAGSLGANKDIVIDTVAPAAPSTPDLDAADDTGLSNSDNITSQIANLTFTGTAEASSTIEIFDGAVSKGTTVATGGNYSFTTSLAQGVHVMTVTATDAAGNKSATSSSLSVTVDTTAPSTPAAPDLDASDDAGISNIDNITNRTTGLTFGGTAETDSVVELFDGAVSKGTTTATLGNYSFDISLSAGGHNLTIIATDAAGNPSLSSEVLTVTVDTTNPSTPSAPDLSSSDDTGTLDNDNITYLTTGLTFSGSTEASTTIEIFDGAVSKGSVASTDSTWTIDLALAAGSYSLTAVATDVAGNKSATSSALSLTIDTTAPSVPSVPDLDAADDTGISNTDNITNQVSNNTFTGTGEIGSTVSIFRQKPGEYFPGGSYLVTDGTWTFNMFINPGTYSLWTSATDVAGNTSATSSSLTVVVDTSVVPSPSTPDLDPADDTGISNTDNITNRTSGLTFTGTVEADSIVELFDGAVSKGTTTATLGSYSFDISLSTGEHDLTTIATDVAGNISTTSAILLVTIDTSTPTVSSEPVLDSSDDSGISNSDDITNLTSGLTFSGTSEANSIVELFDGETSKGTTTAISGSWSFDISLAAGSHSMTALVADLAGNVAATSSALLVVVDTTAPSTPDMPDFDPADDTGISNTDHITKQNANMTFLGTAEASSIVELFYDVTNSKGTTIASGGNWSFTTSLFEGTHGMTITATDAAGNKSATSSSMSITVDISNPSAPTMPDLAAVDDDGVSDTDNITSLTDNLTFSGTAEADSIVELFAGSNSKGTTTATLGNWSFDISLAVGNYNMTAVATDVAGNISAASSNLSLSITSGVFTTPSAPDLDSNDDTGSSNSDNITKNTTNLTFTGTAEADSTVVIYDYETAKGTTTATLGNYSFELSLTAGSHSLSVFSYNATSSATSTALSLTIDTSAPTAPSTPDFAAEDDTGLYDNDNITKQTSNLTYSGTAETDSVVTIYLDDISRGTSIATGGNWSFSGSIPEGNHYLYVTATDAAGNISSNSGSIFMVIDTTKPNTPSAPDLAAEDDSGFYNNDNITNQTSGLTFTGTAEASSTIEIFDGVVSKGTTFASSSAWSLDISLPVGAHNISAKATDIAGNVSDASTPGVIIITDTTPPETPSTPDLAAGDDTGSSDSDNITKNTTNLTFTGTVDDDNIVEIFDGAVSKGTTTAVSGSWSIDISLAAGVHSISALAMDLAGNYSSSSSALSLTIDTTAPSVPSVPDLDAADDTGISNTDNITNQVSNNTFTGTGEIGSTVSIFRQKPGEYFPGGSYLVTDGTWTFNMFINPGTYSLWTSATDVAGNTSATSSSLTVVVDTSVVPSPSTPDLDPADDTGISSTDNITNRTTGLTFTGTVEADSVVELFDGETSKGTTTAISGNYSFDISLSAGEHELAVIATDVAGNISTTSAISWVTVDTSAPAAPSAPDLQTTDDSGISDTDHITKNTSGLTIYGTAESNARIEVFAGAVSKGTATAAGGNWLLDISLSDGSYSITAIATDVAGNTSSVSSSTLLTIDTSAPATPTVIGLDPADDTGISNSDGITKQTSNLTGLGTAESGSTVEIFKSGVSMGTTVATGGNWSFDGSIINGTYSMVVTATDAAGNTSASSTPFILVIDTVLPILAEVTPVPDPTQDTTPNYTFSSTEAGMITYSGTTGCSSDQTSAIAGDNIITFNNLACDDYSCIIQVTDTAGNQSSELYVSAFTVDNIAPVLTEVAPVSTPTNDTTPSYTFNSTEAGTITYGGGCTSTTTTVVLGDNTINFSALGSATYSCTIRVTDAAGNLSSIMNVTPFTVDANAPTVLGVTSSLANGTYNLGQVIPVQVNFSETVIVSGTPRLTLTTGSPATTAVNYSSGSNSSVLTFNYTVASGNLSSDLDYSATNALALNSGSIKDVAGNDAILTLAVPGTAGSLGTSKNIAIDANALVISITASTKSANEAIDDTTIRVTDVDGVLASVVSAASSTVPFDSFVCTQTDANTVDCTINITGSGDLVITAIDNLSNLISATESGYLIDMVAPETSITGNPEAVTDATEATFTFSSSESGTFECRLDGGSFGVCSSPRSYSALAKGIHTFEVRAVDSFSNTDATPASFSWTINGGTASSPVTTPASIGDGQSMVVVPPGGSWPIPAIDNNGINVLAYPLSQVYMPILVSRTYTREEHVIRIVDLDLANNIVIVEISSNYPKTIKIKLGETSQVDLDDDGTNDISVWFANLQVNLSELTIKSLLGEKPLEVKDCASNSTCDFKLVQKLKGRILLQVESHGEAWYVNPSDGKRYYMANGEAAYQVMRKLGVGITNGNLAKVKTDSNFRKRFIGKIFLQVESHGEAYYISADNQYTYLKDGTTAYQVMRKKGLGITNGNLDKMPIGILK